MLRLYNREKEYDNIIDLYSSLKKTDDPFILSYVL